MLTNSRIKSAIAEHGLPNYIAIEGPIGAGKTTLAKRLADSFNYDTLLEQASDNPFLERFYKDSSSNALPTQLFFLFQRAQQLRQLKQGDLFRPVRVADFLIEKDPLFAELTLDEHELAIYYQVYEQLSIEPPIPDLVVYLQAPADVLLERIKGRGIAIEQAIEADYLDALNEAYAKFFHHYDKAPLLMINAANIDWVNNDDSYTQLVEYMLTIKKGRHFFNPTMI